MNVEISRRGFLKGAAATAATMLLVGVTPKGVLSSAGTDGGNLTPFVKITPDGSVTAIIKHFEMGQGTSTGLSSLIAEELGVNIEDVGYEFAPSDPARYANLIFKTFQATGGSTAMANSFMQYRQAGAAAREMLINAAAAEWGVPSGQLSLQDGVISGAGKSAPLSRFVVAAAALDVPAEPKLKDPSEFRVIGNPHNRRRDTPSKIDGTAKYAMDVQLDGQLVVVLKRTPRLGGKVAAFDASAAKQVPAFVNAVTLPTGSAVAVYATNTWAAFQARDAVSVEWDFSAAENRSSNQVRQELLAAVNKEPEFIAGAGSDLAATEAALAGADQVVEHEFYFPMLANAPMEPLTCTIEPVEDGIVLHDGAQLPTASHQALSQILQLELGQIRINTMFAGGSFGRRASADASPTRRAPAF